MKYHLEMIELCLDITLTQIQLIILQIFMELDSTFHLFGQQ
ncbi:MAG: hypothetical protein U0Y96_08405 [Candidatus Kapaibacterium sp.]